MLHIKLGHRVTVLILIHVEGPILQFCEVLHSFRKEVFRGNFCILEEYFIAWSVVIGDKDKNLIKMR